MYQISKNEVILTWWVCVVWALWMLMSNGSFTICPQASDPRPTHVVFLHSLAADKNGRPITSLQALGHFTAIPRMGSVFFDVHRLPLCSKNKAICRGSKWNSLGKPRLVFALLDIYMVFITPGLGVYEHCLCPQDQLLLSSYTVEKGKCNIMSEENAILLLVGWSPCARKP